MTHPKPEINRIYNLKNSYELRIWMNSKIRSEPTFPIANNPLSKRSNTPKNSKHIPKPASPTPISEKTEHLMMIINLFYMDTDSITYRKIFR